MRNENIIIIRSPYKYLIIIPLNKDSFSRLPIYIETEPSTPCGCFVLFLLRNFNGRKQQGFGIV